MPLNEARSFKRSNLTREQRQQAEAAIYGVRESISMPSNNFGQLNQQEVEAMRQLVAQHDNQGKIAEFDLNNPPKVPYRHQDFPRIVYNHDASEPSRIEIEVVNGFRTEKHVEPKLVTMKVNSQEELEKALDAGWSKEVPSQHSDEVLVPAEAPTKRGRK